LRAASKTARNFAFSFATDRPAAGSSKWTRLSFVPRRQRLHALAYNLGNFV
jgi:hypothetical protein